MKRRVGFFGIGAALVALTGLRPASGVAAPATSPGATPPQPSVAEPRTEPSGVPAYVPVTSRVEADVVEAARLLGIPLVRTARFPAASPVAFFCAASIQERQFPQRLRSFVAGGGRALVTSRLAGHLGRLPSDYADRIFILPSKDGSSTVLALPQAQVDRLRNFVLFPLGLRMEAPPRVSLLLLGRDALVIDNQNPFAAGIKLTFLASRWPAIQALTNESGQVPLSGSTVSLQAPPKAAQRFQIVSR